MLNMTTTKSVEKPSSTRERPHVCRSRVRLSLSGGGARGLAHIGVLEVLEENNVRVTALSGASMGGVIAALYAAGYDGSRLHLLAKELARPRQLLKLVELRPGRRGLVSAEKLERFISQFIDPKLTFSELSIPLALSATDLNEGRQVHLTSGNVIKAVMATCAFPGVFPPVEIDGSLLVDGGVLNNLPVDLLGGHGEQPLMAVDVSPQAIPSQDQSPPSIIGKLPAMAEILYRSTLLMNHAITEDLLKEQPPDVLLQPQIPANIGVFDGFTRSEQIIQVGREALQSRINELDFVSR